MCFRAKNTFVPIDFPSSISCQVMMVIKFVIFQSFYLTDFISKVKNGPQPIKTFVHNTFESFNSTFFRTAEKISSCVSFYISSIISIFTVAFARKKIRYQGSGILYYTLPSSIPCHARS